MARTRLLALVCLLSLTACTDSEGSGTQTVEGECTQADECTSGVCSDGVCADSTCGDGVVNGDEACDDGGNYRILSATSISGPPAITAEVS